MRPPQIITRATASTVVAACALCGVASSATAYDAPAPQSTTVSQPQYKDAVKVSWDGTSYTNGIAGSFVGSPVAVPGDSASRTLSVLNDGPTKGVMRVSIVNVTLDSPNAADVDAQGNSQGNFYDDVKVTGTTESKVTTSSLSQLDEQEVTVLGEFEIDSKDTTDVTIGYTFPAESTSGNKANVKERMAEFDVLIEISGDDLPKEPITPGVDSTTPPNPSTPAPTDGATPGTVIVKPNKNNENSTVHVDVAPEVVGQKDNPVSEAGVVPVADDSVDKVNYNTGNARGLDFSQTPVLYLVLLGIPLAFIGYAMYAGHQRNNTSNHTTDAGSK